MAPDMSTNKRNCLAQFLLVGSSGGVVAPGKIAQAVHIFNVSQRTVYNTWQKAREQQLKGIPVHLISKKIGVKREKILIFDQEMMKLIPFYHRQTYRDLGESLGVSKSTIHRWKVTGVIKPHTNAIKPTLTPMNQIARMKFSLSSLFYDVELKKFKFKTMSHTIHMDEKWFHMTSCNERYYIYEGEEEPYRTCQSKKFITKVMFMCAVSRPIYAPNGDLIFDGKIGMWPFTIREPAKRNSRNRAAGTMVTKPVESVNKLVTKVMLINKIIPAIQAKWPPNLSKDIIIQWDNATPHINNNDQDFRNVATTNGFNIQIVFQPPNSPDSNVNDLGWFRSIQSLKTESKAKNIDELVDTVLGSFNNLSHITLNKVFLTLQSCFIEMLNEKGSNKYQIPHLHKDALQRAGLLMVDMEVEVNLVNECLTYLQDADGMDIIRAGLSMGEGE